VNFTREPIIETVITPREGCKLVIKSSKSNTQEDYSVDAVEVVSFGHSFFFRSLEKPKAFLVPVSDYEILEVKETKMVLRNVNIEKSIKTSSPQKEVNSKTFAPAKEVKEEKSEEVALLNSDSTEPLRNDKRSRNRRRQRRGRDSAQQEVQSSPSEDEKITQGSQETESEKPTQMPLMPFLLPPPPLSTMNFVKKSVMVIDEHLDTISESKIESNTQQAPSIEEVNLEPLHETSLESDRVHHEGDE
jgi:hypothetical protein